jgi:photosystem II biogenesis protein Psp29
VNTLRTVSDAKRDFYTAHTRPINSVYRRVVEELLVEMHLLSVNLDFRYDPVYALGVFTSFERFMQGYRPENDCQSIFRALCQSVGGDAQQYRQDAENLLAIAKGMSVSDFLAKLSAPTSFPAGDEPLLGTLQAIKQRPNFKYSRLFAVGLYTVLVEADPEIAKDPEKRNLILKQVSEALNLPSEKLQKDLDIYRSNLDKMDQLLGVIEEALQAERKKREQREQEKTAAETSEH